MTRATFIGGACAGLLLLLVAVAAGVWVLGREADFGAAPSPSVAPSAAPAGVEAHPAAGGQGFLYGRIVTVDGATFEGRLRFGGSQEAFWGDYFHGKERENRWLARVPGGVLPSEEGRGGISILGFEIGGRKGPAGAGRPFMARFGEIERVEARGREVRVTLKSGTVLDLDRLEASDFDDGVRVWDGRRGATDLKSLRIRTIELLPTPPLAAGSDAAPYRLHGTVQTRQGDFTGFVAWNRDDAVGSDTLDGRTAEGEESLRFDTIRSIERRSRDSALVTLLDGRELVLTGGGDVGARNRGIYVDDRRYGSVQVSWDAFERADFGPGGSGPAYGEFPPGSPLTGRVTTRAGRRLEGRLVYDLDESETTDTLDADDRALHYTIPFGLIAKIAPRGPEGGRSGRPTVTLHDGEELQLEPTGDLRPDNAGLLVFAEGRERPEYVPWSEVLRIELDRPPATYPPLAR